MNDHVPYFCVDVDLFIHTLILMLVKQISNSKRGPSKLSPLTCKPTVITKFPPKCLQQASLTSLVRMRFVISSVNSKSWRYFAFLIAVLDAISGLAISISRWFYQLWDSYYRKTSNISRTLVGNKIVDNSDVVGASPIGAAPTTSSFST